MEIHQVLSNVAPGDAIANEALALRPVLRAFGASQVFALSREGPAMRNAVRPLSDYASLPSAASGRNLLLYHSAVLAPDLHRFLLDRPERLILRYHNITPGEFYQAYEPEFAARLDAARRQLGELHDRVELVLADSAFNASDIAALGFTNAVVVPLLMRLQGLTDAEAELPPGLPGPGAGPIITFVGRVAPHKNHGLLIQAFHILKTFLRQDAHLVLVGRSDHPEYLWVLRRFVRHLAIPDVLFLGHVTDAELVGIYRRTDVFVCLSAHEGFGVPLVEAMSLGIPIVAWATGAVADTVAEGGLLLPRPSPALVAEAIEAVISDKQLKETLAERGRQRAKEFDPVRVSQRFIAALQPVAA